MKNIPIDAAMSGLVGVKTQGVGALLLSLGDTGLEGLGGSALGGTLTAFSCGPVVL